MAKQSKKYNEIVKKAGKSLGQKVSLDEACKQIKALSYSKFPGTVDLHLKLAQLDKQASVRGAVIFPNAFGKSKRIIVFTLDPATVKKAKELGAVEAGSEELVKKIMEGWMEFDIAISQPAMMPKIAALGKVLGPKGIMPNPKNGTVTEDIETAVKQYQSGKADFKADSEGVVHLAVSKVDMEPDKIKENIVAGIKTILSVATKTIGSVSTIHIAPTMGPSIEIEKSTIPV